MPCVVLTRVMPVATDAWVVEVTQADVLVEYGLSFLEPHRFGFELIELALGVFLDGALYEFLAFL